MHADAIHPNPRKTTSVRPLGTVDISGIRDAILAIPESVWDAENAAKPNRFGALARLIGQPGLSRLRRAHVAVVGLGGVGSWSVEALARSGLGTLTLIDLDEVCLGNVNPTSNVASTSDGGEGCSIISK